MECKTCLSVSIRSASLETKSLTHAYPLVINRGSILCCVVGIFLTAIGRSGRPAIPRDKVRLQPARMFDAGSKGALGGLSTVATLSELDHIVVCLDKLATGTCLIGVSSDFSQEVFFEFHSLMGGHGAAKIRVICGHADIAGNKEAIALAKVEASLPEPADVFTTLVLLPSIIRQQPRKAYVLVAPYEKFL